MDEAEKTSLGKNIMKLYLILIILMIKNHDLGFDSKSYIGIWIYPFEKQNNLMFWLRNWTAIQSRDMSSYDKSFNSLLIDLSAYFKR